MTQARNSPSCPACDGPMVVRTAGKGKFAGQDFWGCRAYPKCKGTLPVESEGDDGLGFFASFTWPNPSGFTDGSRAFLPCGGSRKADDAPLFRSWNHVCLCTSKSDGPDVCLSANVRVALHVLRRVLGRGLAPPLPQVLEKSLPLAGPPVAVGRLSRPEYGPNETPDPLVKLFRHLLPKKLRPDLAPFVHLNIPAAMVPYMPWADPAFNLDLVLFHPSNGQKAITALIARDDKAPPDTVFVQSTIDSGIELHIIPHNEIRSEGGPALEGFWKSVNELPGAPTWDPHPTVAAHTMLALCEAIELGYLAPGAARWLVDARGKYSIAIGLAVDAFFQLASAVGDLYGCRVAPDVVEVGKALTRAEPNAVVLDWSEAVPYWSEIRSHEAGQVPELLMRPVWLPRVSALPPPPMEWVEPNTAVSSASLRTLLLFVFPGKDSFWEGQEEGIRRCLAGQDSLVLLPTGGGKSLIFQLSTILMPGFSLVVAPLISLMEDQVDNLRRNGVDRAVHLSSTVTKTGKADAVKAALQAGLFFACYVSPERLQIRSFREDLIALAIQMPIPLVVIDEAHCVSEWGHDFRPAYLNLSRNARKYGRRGAGKNPSLVGLTGTASRAVLRDLQYELSIKDIAAVVTPKSFDRPELRFEILAQSSGHKPAALEGLLRSLPARLNVRQGDLFTPHGESTCSGIVFCPHITGQYGVISVSQQLEDSLKIDVPNYSGQMDGMERSKVATRFKRNDAPILVATKAFGMGIDKPNVRYTIHYGLPPSLEAFYQEAGRAGRDKRKAHCALIVSVDDEAQARRLLDPGNDVERLRELFRGIPRNKNDDIVRSLYFHTQAFLGVTQDLNEIAALVSTFGPLEVSGEKEIPFDGREDGPKRIEQALHRLILIDVIEDYTVDFINKKIHAKLKEVSSQQVFDAAYRYVAAYSPSRASVLFGGYEHRWDGRVQDAILGVLRLLLGFIYETIEASRRAAIREAWLWSTLENSDEVLRKRLVDYLQETEFSRAVLDVLKQDEHNLGRWQAILDSVATKRDLQELDSGLGRATEDFPDHPAVLAMRAVIAAKNRRTEECVAYAAGCVRFLRSRFARTKEVTLEYVEWLLRNLPEEPIIRNSVTYQITTEDDGSLCSVVFATYSEAEFRIGVLPRLLALLIDQTETFLRTSQAPVEENAKSWTN